MKLSNLTHAVSFCRRVFIPAAKLVMQNKEDDLNIDVVMPSIFFDEVGDTINVYATIRWDVERGGDDEPDEWYVSFIFYTYDSEGHRQPFCTTHVFNEKDEDVDADFPLEEQFWYAIEHAVNVYNLRKNT